MLDNIERRKAKPLNREVWRKDSMWFRRAVAYRLLHAMIPAPISRRLPRILRDPLIYPGVIVPPGAVLPPGTVLPPGAVFPPGWTPGDPAPPGVVIPPGTVFPPGWAPGDPAPPDVVIPPGTVFPPGWTPGDPLPPDVVDPPVIPPVDSPIPPPYIGPSPGPPRPPPQPHVAVELLYIVPDSKVGGHFARYGACTDYDCLNSGIISGTPDDTTKIGLLDGDWIRLGFVSPAFSGNSTEIKVRVRAYNDFGTDGVRVYLYSDGSTSDGWERTFPTSSYSNFTVTYTIAKSAAQLVHLEVRLYSDSGSFDDYISEVEVEIVK